MSKTWGDFRGWGYKQVGVIGVTFEAAFHKDIFEMLPKFTT